MSEEDVYGLLVGVIGFVGLAAGALAFAFIGEWLGLPELRRCFELFGFWDGLDFCL